MQKRIPKTWLYSAVAVAVLNLTLCRNLFQKMVLLYAIAVAVLIEGFGKLGNNSIRVPRLLLTFSNTFLQTIASDFPIMQYFSKRLPKKKARYFESDQPSLCPAKAVLKCKKVGVTRSNVSSRRPFVARQRET